MALPIHTPNFSTGGELRLIGTAARAYR